MDTMYAWAPLTLPHQHSPTNTHTHVSLALVPEGNPKESPKQKRMPGAKAIGSTGSQLLEQGKGPRARKKSHVMRARSLRMERQKALLNRC